MDFKQKSVLFLDFGLNLELAAKLAESFGNVYYWTPWKSAFSSYTELKIGKDFDGVIRIEDWEPYKKKVDIIVIPDSGFGTLVDDLRSQGLRVWGTGKAEMIEFDRWKMRKLQKAVGLPTQTTLRIVSLDDLILYFRGIRQTLKELSGLEKTDFEKKVLAYLYKKYEKFSDNYFIGDNADKNKLLREWLEGARDKYVKSKFRGMIETFYADDYEGALSKFQKLEKDLGHSSKSKDIEFDIEDRIEGVEPGGDHIQINGDFLSPTMWGYECYDEKTEILTDEGWKFFKDLNKSERFLTLDISDKRHLKIEWQKPERYISYEHKGKMLQIKNNNVDLLVTPGHNLLIQVNSTGKKELKLIEAQKIDIFQPFSMPFPIGYRWKTHKKDNPYILIGKHKFNRKQLAILLGLYLSEGCVHKNEIVISQFKYVKEFESLLSQLPVKFKRTKTGFSCYDKDLAFYLKQFGKAGNKYIPNVIKNASKNILITFLNCFALGDGYKEVVYKRNRKKLVSKEKKVYWTKSKKLADDIQEILIKVGIKSNILKHKNRELYQITEHPIYRKNYITPGQAKWVNYKGKVYCVTVPSGIVMVRRNGKIAWCGNCKGIGYMGMKCDFEEMPEPVREVSEKLGIILKKMIPTANNFSTELIVDKRGKGYLIDPCPRVPLPTVGAIQTEFITNLSEIIWYGAEGNKIEPKFLPYKYCAAISCESEWANQNELEVSFQCPRNRIKFRKAYKKEEKYFAVEGFSSICSIIGFGNTLDEAIEEVKENAKTVSGYELQVLPETLEKMKNEIIEANEKYGIPF